MEELKANTVDASLEKHVPAVTVEGDTVKVQVGSAVHPMLEEHHIEWIYLELENGGSRKALSPGEAPEAVFHTAGVKPVAVYAYCNLQKACGKPNYSSPLAYTLISLLFISSQRFMLCELYGGFPSDIVSRSGSWVK